MIKGVKILSSKKIEELKRQRKREYRRKNKRNQIYYGLCCVLLVGIIFIFLLNSNETYSILWIIGVIIGFTLQRSRFCFAASFRDPIMVGSTSLFKAIIIAFIISTIGFGIIQYIDIAHRDTIDLDNIPGQIQPVGIHTALGAILFGTGMVIAGGCASGTLMRIGEGFILQIIVLIGFIIGTLIGGSHFEFWDKLIISKSPIIYLPQYLGFSLSIILQISLLIGLYLIADWYDKKNNMMSL